MLIETFGFTKDPRVDGLDSYILVMEYATSGDLHKYLQKNFIEIKWREKISILYNITNGYLNFRHIGK
jgi:serine/threonine protein kinase